MGEALSLLPLVLAAALGLWALRRGEDVYGALTEGAADGLRTVKRILPSLLGLLPCVYALRASGAMELLTALLSPVLRAAGIPAETAPLLLIRPFSGSAALAVGGELMARYGVDSPVGRTAAVMLGSTETTFYVLSVYFGAAGIKKSRHAPAAALCADAVGFLAAAWSVRLFFRG